MVWTPHSDRCSNPNPDMILMYIMKHGNNPKSGWICCSKCTPHFPPTQHKLSKICRDCLYFQESESTITYTTEHSSWFKEPAMHWSSSWSKPLTAEMMNIIFRAWTTDNILMVTRCILIFKITNLQPHCFDSRYISVRWKDGEGA